MDQANGGNDLLALLPALCFVHSGYDRIDKDGDRCSAVQM
jgi:hypothetical protein